MQELSNSINDKFGIKLSRSHIASVVRDNNITLKQTRLRHEPITRYKNQLIQINKLRNSTQRLKNINYQI